MREASTRPPSGTSLAKELFQIEFRARRGAPRTYDERIFFGAPTINGSPARFSIFRLQYFHRARHLHNSLRVASATYRHGESLNCRGACDAENHENRGDSSPPEFSPGADGRGETEVQRKVREGRARSHAPQLRCAPPMKARDGMTNDGKATIKSVASRRESRALSLSVAGTLQI